MSLRRAGELANQIPVVMMSGFCIAPLAIFWMQAWGPLRPFGVAPAASPQWPWFASLLALSIATWWMPPRYFRLNRFERSGRIYEMLGVRQFSWLVTDGELINRYRRRESPGFRLIQHWASAREFLERTYAAERGHLPWLLAGALSSYWAVHIGWIGWALYLSLSNALVNLWPIMLQRYTRGRIGRVLK